MIKLSLRGINGQHLWGFLTAIGTLSLLDEHAQENRLEFPRLSFDSEGTAVMLSPIPDERLAAVLLAKLRALQPYLEGSLGDINRPSDFDRKSYESIASASVTSATVSLLGGLACVVGEEVFESTLCAANGASHQNLLQSMRDVLGLVEEEHVRLALFEFWKKEYRVPDDKRKQLKLGTRKPTLRLDPSDERLTPSGCRIRRRRTTIRRRSALRRSPFRLLACCQLFPASGRSPWRRIGRASG